jgi:predicted PurR-regulated permease PerM
MTETRNNERRILGRGSILVLTIAALALLLYTARAMIGPLVIACLLAYLLNPAVNLLKKHTRLRHHQAVPIVFGLFLIMVFLLLLTFLPIITRQAQDLSRELKLFLPQIDDIFSKSISRLGFDVSLAPLITQLQETSLQLFRPERLFRVIQSATTNLAWVLVILVTTYYLLRDWEPLREWIIQLAPEPEQTEIRRIHREIKTIWSSYFRGQLLIMLLVGLCSGLTAALIGLPRSMLLGALAGSLEIIPSIGPAVATAFAAALALLEGSTTLAIPNAWLTLLVILLFSLIQLIENIWIQPIIIGHRLRLHRGLVFIAIIGTLTLGSALLTLIIVPIIASVMVIGSYLRQRLWEVDSGSSHPFSGKSTPSPEANEIHAMKS